MLNDNATEDFAGIRQQCNASPIVAVSKVSFMCQLHNESCLTTGQGLLFQVFVPDVLKDVLDIV